MVVRPTANKKDLAGTKRDRETAKHFADVPENDYELKCCFCNTSRTLKGGQPRHRPDKMFRCTYIEQRCKRKKGKSRTR